IHTGDAARRKWPAVAGPAPQLSFKANLLPSALPGFLVRLAEFPEIVWQACAGSGIVIGHSDADWPLEQADKTLTALRKTAIAAQGNLVVTRCPPTWKRELKIWGE